MRTGLGRSPVEVQRRPLGSGAGGSWRELAVEVLQCPLRSVAGEEARSGGGEREEGAESYLKI